MRPAQLLPLVVMAALSGCGEASTPREAQAPRTPPLPRARELPEPIVLKALTPVTPANTSGFSPRLTAPTAPPEETNFDYAEWLSVEGLPAISSDGALLARITAAGFVEREGKGDTVRLEIVDTSDYKLKQSVDLLLPEETYALDEEALSQAQAALPERVAPRVAAAQKLLDGVAWLPLTELSKSGSAFVQKSPDPLKLSFDSKGLHLTIEIKKKKVKDQKFPEWKAPKATPCNKKAPVEGCGCEYPLSLQEALYAAELRLFLLSFEYQTTRACQAPPADHAVAISYK